MKKVTMQDIADQLGLTKVSVSKALNGQPGVSAQTRARILETAQQLGYRMRQGENEKKYRLAMIVPKRYFLETEAFYTEIIYYLNRYALRDGQHIYTVVLNAAEEEGLELPDALTDPAPDGIFIIGQLNQAYLAMLAKLPSRLIAVDFYNRSLAVDSILTDNFYVGYSAAQYLVERGHKKIGYVGRVTETSSSIDRYFGYKKALHLAGLEEKQDCLLCNSDVGSGYTASIALPNPMPTAFVCHCDMAGHYLIQTLRAAGYKVPEDVSVITVDNTTLCEQTSPKLTAMAIQRKEMAKSAYMSMLERCDGREDDARRIFVSSKLIERESVVDRM